jgi:hypothetical protein
MNCMVRIAFSLFVLAGFGLLLTLPGCSGGTPATGKVSGTVTHDGQPVTSGSLTFAPTGGTVGKPASGIVKSDGSFTLTTYAPDDGAVVGRHKVVYLPGSAESGQEQEPALPEPGEHDEEEAAPEVPFSGLVPKEAEVEVKAGNNEINIELVAQAKPAGQE